MANTGVRVGKAKAQEIGFALADAVAELDIDQEDREKVAAALADTLRESVIGAYLNRDLIRLLASDPLVPCAGYDIPVHGETTEHVDCPNGMVIRQMFHNSDAPDGRSAMWKQRAPYGEIRCVSCGSMQFIPEYRDNVLARTGGQ